MPEITRVEQTITINSHPGVLGNCLQAAVATLLGRPLLAVPHFVQFADWHGAIHLWAGGEGLKFVRVYDPKPEEIVLAFGASPRGTSHAVVWKDGKCIADPHPDQTGLSGAPYEFWTFLKADTHA